MLFALTAWWLWIGSAPDPGYVVITSTATPITTVSRDYLGQVYLKKRERLGKTRITPIHLPETHALRRVFEADIHHPRFDPAAYWLQQRLQGGERPPLEVAGEAFMLIYIERNPGTIGYVAAATRDALKRFKIKVVQVTP